MPLFLLSYAAAARRILFSPKQFPIIWTPIGIPALSMTARNRDSRQTTEVDGNGINIAKIHGKRILEAFSNLRRSIRSCRCKDHIIFFKGTVKFLS